SLSLEKRREAIAKRFESIYQQLGLLEDNVQDALKTGIVGYGENVHMLLRDPSSDLPEMLNAVKSIKNDESGQENLFSAISETLRIFLPVKRRTHSNMMLIVVTDERGDDGGDNGEFLEEIIGRCARSGVKAYVIGNSSIFGRKEGYVHYEWDYEGEHFSEDLAVDQGPETVLPEGLKLPFWRANARKFERMSSGYGAYTLARLCSETGGIFFVADESREMAFDPIIMRRYTPDYRSSKVYNRELQTNSAKLALVQAAGYTLLDDTDIPVPTFVFNAPNDNVLREEITEAQKPMAVLDNHLSQMSDALERGEKDRGKLDSDRWRAAYDLAMGRVLAMRVRAYGYNSVLAEMKASPRTFTKSDNNQWRLVPSEKIIAGASVKRMHDKALEYLNRVVDEHAGTPWAKLAQIELSDPLGWDWQEQKAPVAMGGNGGAGRQGPQFAPEEEARRRQAQQRAQKLTISKPKL
ncbi:MAG: VWA domain-containing protein, partial [Planctomycetaceae bacterium]|nr:VWA domain-containing protein [Planctomycetaceae bacterium]